MILTNKLVKKKLLNTFYQSLKKWIKIQSGDLDYKFSKVFLIYQKNKPYKNLNSYLKTFKEDLSLTMLSKYVNNFGKIILFLLNVMVMLTLQISYLKLLVYLLKAKIISSESLQLEEFLFVVKLLKMKIN